MCRNHPTQKLAEIKLAERGLLHLVSANDIEFHNILFLRKARCKARLLTFYHIYFTNGIQYKVNAFTVGTSFYTRDIKELNDVDLAIKVSYKALGLALV